MVPANLTEGERAYSGKQSKMRSKGGKAIKVGERIDTKAVLPERMAEAVNRKLTLAAQFASHKGNQKLLAELAEGVHQDFGGFTAQFVLIAVFKGEFIAKEDLLKFYLIDLNTGEETKLD